MELELEPLEQLLIGSKFEGQSKVICDMLRRTNVLTLSSLDNSPRTLGPKIAGFSTYQLVIHLRQAVIEREIESALNLDQQIEEEE